MSKPTTLEIKNLHVEVEETPILRGIDLIVKTNEVHALMGPNGSGKSTLAYALMGHPFYEVTEGQVLLDGEDLLEMDPDERARQGLFLAFQYPGEVPGVSLANFLRTAYSALHGGDADDEDRLVGVAEFHQLLMEKMKLVEMDEEFAQRYLNEGFSGGEKKKGEMLHMAVLQPKLAIMDETDSGLDIDSLQTVANVVNHLRGPEFGALVITHYQRILNYIKPDFVHVMFKGRIVRSGGPGLAEELEEKGYEWLRSESEGVAVE